MASAVRSPSGPWTTAIATGSPLSALPSRTLYRSCEGAKQRCSRATISSSPRQSRRGSESRFDHWIMTASRSTSSSTAASVASSSVGPHARPLLVGYPIRASPAGLAEIDELGGEEGRLAVGQREALDEREARRVREGLEREPWRRELPRVEQGEPGRIDGVRAQVERGRECEPFARHERRRVALDRLPERSGARPVLMRVRTAAVVDRGVAQDV